MPGSPLNEARWSPGFAGRSVVGAEGADDESRGDAAEGGENDPEAAGELAGSQGPGDGDDGDAAGGQGDANEAARDRRDDDATGDANEERPPAGVSGPSGVMKKTPPAAPMMPALMLTMALRAR